MDVRLREVCMQYCWPGSGGKDVVLGFERMEMVKDSLAVIAGNPKLQLLLHAYPSPDISLGTCTSPT